jgi:hypothetical protein
MKSTVGALPMETSIRACPVHQESFKLPSEL